MVNGRGGKSFLAFWHSWKVFQTLFHTTTMFRCGQIWIENFLISYFLYLGSLKGFVGSYPSLYLIIYLQGGLGSLFPRPGLTDNLTLLREKKKKYIHHYHNRLGLSSLHLHFYQFTGTYILLVISFDFHSHIFAGTHSLLVFSPHSPYHQVDDTLIKVIDWKNSWLVKIQRYCQN